MRKINLNENAYTAGERQFVLYEYLRRNATKEHVVTKQDLLNELQKMGLSFTRIRFLLTLGSWAGRCLGFNWNTIEAKKADEITKKKNRNLCSEYGGLWVREATKKALCGEPKAVQTHPLSRTQCFFLISLQIHFVGIRSEQFRCLAHKTKTTIERWSFSFGARGGT